MLSWNELRGPWSLGVTTLVILVLISTIRRLYLHPLSKYPGPPLWVLTRLPYMRSFRNGHLSHDLRRFHERYGPIVRVAPNELSFINPGAIHDIYQRRPPLPKDPVRFPPPRPGQPISILDALEDDHRRIRKAWNSSFTTQALQAQEPLVISYVEKFISKLDALVQSGTNVIDLQQWYSFCTFDIIGALSFGEDFGCLDNSRYHKWVGGLVYSIKGKVQLAACRFYPWVYRFLVYWNTTPAALAAMAQGMAMAREKVDRRLASSTQSHPDFLESLQKSKHELSKEEIVTNSATMIFAGSHTLQSQITGLTFLLLHNPDKLKAVTAEIRDASAKVNGRKLTTSELSKLPYLNAAIQEAFRVITPVPLNMTRLVADEGVMIDRQIIPVGTIVGYMSWAANHSPANFMDPEKFIPERWLTQSADQRYQQYKNDKREANSPFLMGSRDCLGQNLAKLEILQIMAHLLLNFDLQLPNVTDASKTLQAWEDQETYAVWDRSPLLTKIEPAPTSG